MPWTPEVQPDEVVLVACNVEARRGVPFHILLTDKRLIVAQIITVIQIIVALLALTLILLRHCW